MKKYLYFTTETAARNAIKNENTRQANAKTFYNVELRKTKSGRFAVVIG